MKKPKLKTLRRKLKAIFSEYIRRRDSKDLETLSGECCTCKDWFYWKVAHAGHFVEVGTATQGTEFDERNVHLQCCYCNTFCGGRKAVYALFMERKYGKGIIEELVKQSEWSLIKFVTETISDMDGDKLHPKTTQEAYELLIEHYSYLVFYMRRMSSSEEKGAQKQRMIEHEDVDPGYFER